jgi:hypothetical protein
MENTLNKDDGYALPEKDDPWALGEGPWRWADRFSCRERALPPPARIRAPKRATLRIC